MPVEPARTPRYAGRRRRNTIAMGLAVAATAFGLGWLVLILGALLWKGFSGLSVANGRVYLGTYDSVLYCFGL